MKKVIVVFVFVSFFISCKKEKDASLPVTEEVVAEAKSECYSSIKSKDTITMDLKIDKDLSIVGNLCYRFFEKDKNDGTVVGKLQGDTLIADYTFMSEGVTSMRQVVFVKKGNTYVEGFGDITTDSSGKVTYKDLKTLKFGDSVVLTKVNCEQ